MVRISSNKLPVLIALVFIGASATSAQTEVLNLGGVIISVSDSRTAQVFHIVDQMSQWDSGVHHGYVRWATRTLNLRPEDLELLQKHAEMRRARGWGNGFEQAFLVDNSIQVATDRAVTARLLSVEEAESEGAILLHFAPRLMALREKAQGQIDAFKSQLVTEHDRL